MASIWGIFASTGCFIASIFIWIVEHHYGESTKIVITLAFLIIIGFANNKSDKKWIAKDNKEQFYRYKNRKIRDK
ncbi:MAG: hypothetical protein LBL65_05120 [Campylobacteraceae bacterium]|jgi:hypothetical protein|nr:hypothetical protein [Campylobacteraceae bacterium]